jgi:hypothetical protein
MGTIIHAICIIKEYQEELYILLVNRLLRNVIMKRFRYKFLTPRFDYWKRIDCKPNRAGDGIRTTVVRIIVQTYLNSLESIKN